MVSSKMDGSDRHFDAESIATHNTSWNLKLPPGPKAWAIIFEHYPELILTPEALAQKFRESAARASREADALLDRYIPRTNFPN